MSMEKQNKILHIGEMSFTLCLFFYAAFGACNLTYKRWPISAALYATTALGLALLTYRALHLKKYLRMPLLACAVLMWLSYIFSTLCNLSYLNKDGIVFFGLWTLYFFLLYLHENAQPATDVYRNMRLISVVYIGWTVLLVLISFGMLIRGYDYSYVDTENGNFTVAAGIHEGRLWGAFQDPNLGAVMCVIGIAVAVYWFHRKREVWLRVVLALTVLSFLLYIALSDSRNGMLCTGVLCAVGAAFGGYLYGKKQKRRWAVVWLLLIVLAIICGIFTPYLIQRAYNAAINSSGLLDPHEIQRNYELENSLAGFSNRRFWVWKSAVEIGMRRPLTGVSFTGVLPYVREYLPETYIVNNDYWIMNTFDSEIFNIFAAQGIPGILTLLVWFILAAILFFRNIGKVPVAEKDELFLLTVIVCVLITSALNQGTMFYQTTPNTVMFWVAFGDLLFILKKTTEK